MLLMLPRFGGANHANRPEGDGGKTIGLDIAKSIFQVHGVDAGRADETLLLCFIARSLQPKFFCQGRNRARVDG